MKKFNLKRVAFIILLFSLNSNLLAKQLDIFAHIHPHTNVEQLIQSKKKSNMTYKQIMVQFGIAYAMVQEGVINQDKNIIKIGLDKIQNHPSSKEHPWKIVKTRDMEAFKESLLYYDNLLHKSATDIQKSLKTNDWTTINKNIFKLSNHCINCHLTWKNNLD